MANPHSLSPITPREAGDLVVLSFADMDGAFALRDLLAAMEEEGVIEIGDSVVVTRDSKGKIRLHQSLPLVAARSAMGSFVGMIAGMLLLNPVLGIVAGAAAGALCGAFGDIGINDEFMERLGATLTPGSSALFVMVGQRKREEMESRLKPFAGKCKVLQTSLPAENEDRLRRFMVDELPNNSNVP
jgi:uncharacterized membrane protein